MVLFYPLQKDISAMRAESRTDKRFLENLPKSKKSTLGV